MYSLDLGGGHIAGLHKAGLVLVGLFEQRGPAAIKSWGAEESSWLRLMRIDVALPSFLYSAIKLWPSLVHPEPECQLACTATGYLVARSMMVSMCGQLSFDQFNQVQMYVFGPDF